MIPLEHVPLGFDGLDKDLRQAMGFVLASALVEAHRAQRIRSERDAVEASAACPAPSRPTPRAVGDAVSAAASNDRASGEGRPAEAPASCRGFPARNTHLDHLETALTRTVAEASALIEQSKREVERSRGLLNKEPG